MLDVAPTEFLLVAVIAVVVIGPKDLPKAMRVVGHWVGRARGVARQFRQGFDDIVREAEFKEMEQKWAEENTRIMREFPAGSGPTSALPAPATAETDGPIAADMTPQPELHDDASAPIDAQPGLFDEAAAAPGDANAEAKGAR